MLCHFLPRWPALMNNKVGSLCGTTGDEGTKSCTFPWKNLTKVSRTSYRQEASDTPATLKPRWKSRRDRKSPSKRHLKTVLCSLKLSSSWALGTLTAKINKKRQHDAACLMFIEVLSANRQCLARKWNSWHLVPSHLHSISYRKADSEPSLSTEFAHNAPDFFAREGAEEPFASSGGIKDAVATLTGSIPMDER